MEARPLTGRLLIASPALADPNFDRTVVLMLEHNDEGALGLVLNRPTELRLRDVVEVWSFAGAEPAVVFAGGPVATDSAMCLAHARWESAPSGWRPVVDDVGITNLTQDPADMPAGIESIRLFAGYAGWAPGQLEAELEVEAWFVAAAAPGDAMTASPQRLWRDVLRRQGGALALVSTYPADPGLN